MARLPDKCSPLPAATAEHRRWSRPNDPTWKTTLTYDYRRAPPGIWLKSTAYCGPEDEVRLRKQTATATSPAPFAMAREAELSEDTLEEMKPPPKTPE